MPTTRQKDFANPADRAEREQSECHALGLCRRSHAPDGDAAALAVSIHGAPAPCADCRQAIRNCSAPRL